MKILRVFSDDGDYAASHFETEHRDVKVSDIIANPDNYLPSDENNSNGELWEFEVIEFDNDVNMEFIDFARNQMDYDATKHDYYYHESETI